MILDIKNFSNDVLAGQKIITGFNSTKFDDKLKKLLLAVKPGGIILFTRNISTPEKLKKLNLKIKDFFRENMLPPPFIAIDQEGGCVARLKEPQFKELEALELIDSVEKSVEHAQKMSHILKDLHINMNMAPVLDTASLHKESIMKKRSFPGTPKNIAELGAAMIKTYTENNIIAVGKHFPGIGGTTLDSHLCLPAYEKNFEEMEKTDLIPFKKAIESDVPALMFSHILYEKLDHIWPASLSKKICLDLLRNKMNYHGVTMTDDLDMKAICYNMGTCVRKIIDADQDIALICNQIENTPKVYTHFKEALNSDNNEPILKSVQRIFALKNKFLVHNMN